MKLPFFHLEYDLKLNNKKQCHILNLVYLSKHYGLDEVAEYWHQVVKINDYQKDRFAQKIIDHFGGNLSGKTIAILGWAFKANTNDTRESAAIYVAEKLHKAGAFLEIYDLGVSKTTIENDINSFWKNDFDKIKNKVEILYNPPNFDKIDISVILTEWKEFKSFDFKKSIIFDGRNILENQIVISIGK